MIRKAMTIYSQLLNQTVLRRNNSSDITIMNSQTNRLNQNYSLEGISTAQNLKRRARKLEIFRDTRILTPFRLESESLSR